MSTQKRAASRELTRDDDSDRSDGEQFVTTPQVADAEEMATRRVVKVRRTSPAAPAAPAGGFFQNLAGTAAPTANSGFPLSFGAAAAKPEDGSSAEKKEGASQAPAPTAFGFGFGAAASKPGAAAAPVTFSFGAPAAKKDGEAKTTVAASAPAFGFGFDFGTSAASNSTTTTTTASAPSFGFNFDAKPSTATNTTTAGIEEKKAEASGLPKGLFGSANYNFGVGVKNFADAQKKLNDAQPVPKAESGEKKATEDGAATAAADDDEDAPKLFASKSDIVAAGGEVLASGPSKLYIFDKDGAKWKEHGEGEAKVKHDVLPIEEGKADGKEQTLCRLMVRDGYSLNAPVAKDIFVLSKEAEKHLIFSIAQEKGVETYLLKLTGPSAEANAKKVIEAVKKAAEIAAPSA